ncbi:MAG: DUF58 domain-containing protein, partial [Acidobacteria bacterium]|nr:DUF58 domain-containing protein [Acidobacteriota bacterium]
WFASRLSVNRLSVSLRFPDHIFVEEDVPFEVTVLNRKRLIPAFSIAVAMSEQSLITTARELTEIAYFPIIPAKTKARMRIERSFAKRGLYPVRGFEIITKFPFGFIKQRRFLEAPTEIAVYPQPQSLDDFYHLMPKTEGQMESRMKGSGSDLHAIRQYLSSDHHHHIDWKATAKTTQLMVREFSRDDDWRVTIAFDAQVEKELIDRPEFVDKFERAITLTATLLNYFITEGAEVRLLTGSEDSGFGIGQLHFYMMLRQLAPLAPETSESGLREKVKKMLTPLPGTEEQFRILIASAAQILLMPQLPHPAHHISFEEL